MSDENNGATPAPAAPPDGGANNGQPSRSDEPLRNYGEVVELKKDLRDVKKTVADMVSMLQSGRAAVAEAKPAAQADSKQPQPVDHAVLARVEGLERRAVLAEACAEHGIAKGTPQWDFVSELAAVASMDKVPALVAKFASAQPKVQAVATPAPAVTAAAPDPAAPPKPNPGAPGASPSTVLPEDPFLLTGEQVRAMGPDELLRRAQSYIGSGGNGSFFKPKPRSK